MLSALSARATTTQFSSNPTWTSVFGHSSSGALCLRSVTLRGKLIDKIIIEIRDSLHIHIDPTTIKDLKISSEMFHHPDITLTLHIYYIYISYITTSYPKISYQQRRFQDAPRRGFSTSTLARPWQTTAGNWTSASSNNSSNLFSIYIIIY